MDARTQSSHSLRASQKACLLDREEFIERQVAFQLRIGDALPELNLREVVRNNAAGRINLTYHNPADMSFVPEDRGRELAFTAPDDWQEALSERHGTKPALTIRALRNASFLNAVYSLGITAPVVVDMQDAVRKPNVFPTFQYNRQAGAANAILWPHRRVHNIGAAEFCKAPDPAEPAFEDKQPIVFWRGSLRGFSRLNGDFTNIRSVIRNFQTGTTDKETLLAHLQTVPRYAFVSRYFGEAGFDIGFKQPPELANYLEIPEIARFEVPFAGPNRQMQARYLVSIQGTDVGSSFGWQLGTNSILLKEEYGWEVFFDCHFLPWEHFVPLAADFSDLPEKLAWCERNAEACRQMARNRHLAVGLLLEAKTRLEALRRVVLRYNEFYARWSGSPKPK